MEKCMAKCKANQFHLQLRNKTFYYRVELPRVNNKRRYKIISLHTQNYFEANERIKQMITLEENFARLQRLFNNLIFEDIVDTNIATIVSPFSKRRLSKRNKVEDVTMIYELYNSLAQNVKNLTQEKQNLLQKIEGLENVIKEYIGPLNVALAEFNKPKPADKAPTTPSYTIEKVLESMLLLRQASNKASYQARKKQTLVKMLNEVGLSLDNDYGKFHNVEMIERLSKRIINDTSMMNDNKKMKIHYLKELATCGHNINPDFYKAHVINNFPQIENTKKVDKKPHLPYRKEQLLEIFDPKHTYFKNNPDAFWVCMIALFTGARINAAITLQYKDIVIEDGVNCIQFISDNPVKQLKNNASERLVPIHKQLLDLGFINYINQQKTRLKAKDTDFIIKKCQTKSGEYNNKYFTRELSPFFMDIKVKTSNNDGYDFHSFRKNISVAMQDAGVGGTYINDIIGWEGKNTMEQSYSKHHFLQIQSELNKFNYDFLTPHFAKWKVILAKK